jgi:hypothetical protein
LDIGPWSLDCSRVAAEVMRQTALVTLYASLITPPQAIAVLPDVRENQETPALQNHLNQEMSGFVRKYQEIPHSAVIVRKNQESSSPKLWNRGDEAESSSFKYPGTSIRFFCPTSFCQSPVSQHAIAQGRRLIPQLTQLNPYVDHGLTQISPETPSKIPGQSNLIRANTGQLAFLNSFQPNTGYRKSRKWSDEAESSRNQHYIFLPPSFCHCPAFRYL